MKKILALVLAALMLLSAFAVAEAPIGGKQLTIKDIAVDAGGASLDLSGLDLILACAENGEQSGLRLALEGAGASILNAIAAVDSEQIAFTVDGLSDTYAISLADMQAMAEAQGGMSGAFQDGFNAGFSFGTDLVTEEAEAAGALIERAAEMISGGMTPADPQTIDGVEYEVTDVAISEDQIAELLDGLAEIIDRHPEIMADSGYASFAAALEDLNLRMSAQGTLLASEDAMILSLDLSMMAEDMTEPETICFYMEAQVSADGLQTDLNIRLDEVEQDAQGREEDFICQIVASYVETEDGFGSLEASIIADEEGDEGIYLNVYAPSTQDNGLWQFSIGSISENESLSFHVVSGNADGQDLFSVLLYADDVSATFDYAGVDGIGEVALNVMQGDAQIINISASVEIADDDGSWLPGSARNAVNILTIDEAQMQKVSSEGMALLLNVMYGVSQANETLASLFSGMMSGEMQ